MKLLLLTLLFSAPVNSTLLSEIDSAKLFGAIAYVESKCGQYTTGDDHKSLGMYQVKFTTARNAGFKGNKNQLQGKLTNFIYSYFYFMDQYKEFGSVERSLAAYNGGPGLARTVKLPNRCRKTAKGETVGCYIRKVFKSMKDNTYCKELF